MRCERNSRRERDPEFGAPTSVSETPAILVTTEQNNNIELLTSQATAMARRSDSAMNVFVGNVGVGQVNSSSKAAGFRPI